MKGGGGILFLQSLEVILEKPMAKLNQPTFLSRTSKWFDPRARTINMLGFILNRVTALGLTVYLVLHLFELRQLSQGAAVYNGFIASVHSPLYVFLEVLVIAGGFIHGLNGVRIALISFGVGTRYQKALMVGLVGLAVLVSAIFAFHMFSVE
jgi:succinate dehydrogenase / fumarate reductase, cytochrome b subunit